jgi:hypothetical protein
MEGGDPRKRGNEGRNHYIEEGGGRLYLLMLGRGVRISSNILSKRSEK